MSSTIFVFIDASNLWAAQKARGCFLDYTKLIDFIGKKFDGSVVKTFYYSAYPADGTRNYNLDSKHKFFTFLKKGLGFVVRKKELKRICVIGELGESFREKGNMDVEITIDALHHAAKYDTAVFFTGDSDFLALVKYLRAGGKKVFIFSSKNNISHELKTGGNGYFNVLNPGTDIWGKKIKFRTETKTALREEDGSWM